MRLKEKTSIITGASSGIGRETALLFSREGARVVAVDINEEGGRETVEAIKNEGGDAVFVRADVSQADQCKAMIDRAESAFGHVHVLFNNAGIMHSQDDNAETTEESIWDLTMAINAKGVFLGCKYGIPALRRAGGGSIINTASFVAILGAATPQIAYTASKGALTSLTRSMAVSKSGTASTTATGPKTSRAQTFISARVLVSNVGAYRFLSASSAFPPVST